MPPNLEATTRMVGGYAWIETQLFSLLGGWVQKSSDPAVKLMLDRHSMHHAWRAAQWTDRLPVLADVDRDGLVVSPGPGASTVVTALAGLTVTVERLAGTYRVALPRLWAAYDRLGRDLSPISDGSVLRTTAMVAIDLAADWHEGEAALQDRLVDEVAISQVGAVVSRLEGLLVKGGSAG
jgi:hypothetical protein